MSLIPQNMIGVNNSVTLPAVATVGGVTANLVPQVLVSYSAATAVGTTGVAVYTSPLTYPAGVYQVICEIYMTKPTANWATTDTVTWVIAAATGGSDSLAQRYQPYYVAGALSDIAFNIAGLITLSVNSKITVTPTYGAVFTGATYQLNGLTIQQVS